MKPLMIGVGAPKAGTTWLYSYLCSRPDCSDPPLKEMHFFNNLREDNFRKLSARIERRIEESNPEPIKRRRMLAYKAGVDAGAGTDEVYLSALMDGTPTGTMKYEITPSYALLETDILRRINALTDDVRFVYLIRDPIDRIWSHARMKAMTRSGLGKARVWAKDYTDQDLTDMVADAEGLIKTALKRNPDKQPANLLAFSSYSQTIGRLKSVVPDNKLYIGFFEELFDQEQVKELCRFLDLPFIAADFDQRYSYSFDVKLDMGLQEQLLKRFAEEYQKVKELVGHVPPKWEKRLAKLS